ncbi:MAG: 3-isopropylmalate dehydratase small subunit [Flavobacteriaceae bacterium]|nr:3-isopropylmalate dehydratase small subunit [Flavobacteriaceae bacterium]MBL6683902.1 3-isopropylmalate dehydratase small subunit [Flavobacteriaceae bacterium]
MSNKKINIIDSSAVPIPIENIDTDQIIPARFLKATSKLNFGENLFRDWRFKSNNKINNDFILNNPLFNGNILLAGANFGCGSSREHAAWAIKDYGFDVVISSFFADIFKMNALNNNILPIQVNDELLKYLFDEVFKNPKIKIKIDLPEQILIINDKSIKFDVDNYKKMCLINGYDDIDYLISKKDLIKDFIKDQ